MTNEEFSTTLDEVYRQYPTDFISYAGLSMETKIKGCITEQIRNAYLDNNAKEIPQKIRLDYSIKRKYISSALAELGLKVTHITKKHGKTTVYFEPISDSE